MQLGDVLTPMPASITRHARHGGLAGRVSPARVRMRIIEAAGRKGHASGGRWRGRCAAGSNASRARNVVVTEGDVGAIAAGRALRRQPAGTARRASRSWSGLSDSEDQPRRKGWVGGSKSAERAELPASVQPSVTEYILSDGFSLT